MATEPRTAPPTATRAGAVVSNALGQTERRIRVIDLLAAGLGFVAGTCVYAAVTIGVDRVIALPEAVRQFLFIGYAVCAAAYVAFFVVRPLSRRINPYFAAREVERTLPGAKNSVINWVDLHGRPLAPAILDMVGRRAAKDLARADIDSAISSRRAAVTGGVAAAAGAVLFAILLSLGAGPFADGLARAFAPFSYSGPSRTRTRLAILRPEAGNATVPVGRGVTITVEAGGKLPDPKNADAIRLQYRYGPEDPWLERPMSEDSGNEFSVNLSATDIRSGFWYKVAGGDAETAEYRIGVRSTPQILEFQATYHFPEYAAMPKETRHDRVLRAVRGSEASIWALTNRTIREAHLDFEGKDGRKTYAGAPVPGDVQAFQVRLPLNETGLYRLGFTSAEGDVFTESLHPLEVLADFPPDVQLTKPGKDGSLPVNGLLSVEGRAADEFGVRELTLRMKTIGRVLKAKPYRSADALRLAGGGYPQVVAYKDTVDLARLEADDGGQFQSKPGMDVEYWLEAADACQPKANVSASKHFHLLLTEPQKDEAKQQQAREAARKEQQDHEAKQDEQLKQEGASRQEQSKQADQKEQQHGQQQNKGQQNSQAQSGGQSSKDQSGNSQNQGTENKTDQKQGQNAGQEAQSKENGNGGGDDAQQKQQDTENQAKANRLKQALENKAGQQKNDSSRAKPDSKDAGGDQSNSADGGKDSTQNQSQKQDKPADGKDGQTSPDGSKDSEKNQPQKQDKPADGKDRQNSNERRNDAERGAAGSRADKSDDRHKQDGTNQPNPSDGDRADASGNKSNGQQRSGDQQNRQPNSDKGSGNSKKNHDKTGAKSGDAGQDRNNDTRENQERPDGSRQAAPKGDKPDQGRDAANPKANPESNSQRNEQSNEKKSTGAESTKPDPKSNDNQKQGGSPDQSNAEGNERGNRGEGVNKESDSANPDKGNDSGSKTGAGKRGTEEKGAKSAGDSSRSGDEHKDAGQAHSPAAEAEKKAGSNDRKDARGSDPAGSTSEKKADDERGGSDSRKATPDDVRKVAKDLQSNDPGKRAEAAKKLNDIQQQARDGDARQQARQSLEQAKQSSDPSTSDGSKEQGAAHGNKGQGNGQSDKQGATKQETVAGQKDGQPNPGKMDGEAKNSGERSQNPARNKPDQDKAQGERPGDEKETRPDARGHEKKGQPADDASKDGQESRNQNQTDGKVKKGNPAAGEAPGEGGPENRRRPDQTNEQPATSQLPSGKPRDFGKKTELQLEDLDKVTKKELDAANLTEKDLAALRQWLKEQKKSRPKADAKEQTVAPRAGGQGASFSSGRVQPGTAGKPNDLSGGARAEPPPGYREANEAFKRMINKDDTGGH
jgi:hypothetical protein